MNYQVCIFTFVHSQVISYHHPSIFLLNYWLLLMLLNQNIRAQVRSRVETDMLRSQTIAGSKTSYFVNPTHAFLLLFLSFPPQPLLETSPSLSLDPCLSPSPQHPLSHVHELLSLNTWVKRRREKKEGAADYTPASGQDPHSTQPKWFTDEASFHFDKRRDVCFFLFFSHHLKTCKSP